MAKLITNIQDLEDLMEYEVINSDTGFMVVTARTSNYHILFNEWSGKIEGIMKIALDKQS